MITQMSLMQSSENSRAPLLQLHEVGFQYSQRCLFAGLSAHITGGLVLVRGGDGSGKSTLLRLLAGELPLQTGQVRLNGLCVATQTPLYRQHVYWTEPHTADHDQITALQYFAQLRQRYPGFAAADAPHLHTLISGLSLETHIHKPLYMLSTGSKRKVWLAGALAAGAALTLLDDPFAALDKPSIGFVMQQLCAAASNPAQVWVLAAYEEPGNVPLAHVINLGD